MQFSSTTQRLSVEIVTLEGRLDALVAADLRAHLESILQAGTHQIIVDLSVVEFVDSAGLAALVKAMKDARKLGGDLRLVRPQGEDAWRVFELTRFDQVFSFGDTVDELTGER